MKNELCREVGFIRNKAGKVLSRELVIGKGGVKYLVSVGLPDYLAQVGLMNSTLPEDAREFDNILPMKDISSVKEICRQLSKIPLNKLQPYLTPQEE